MTGQLCAPTDAPIALADCAERADLEYARPVVKGRARFIERCIAG